jgi:hypothetical protein
MGEDQKPGTPYPLKPPCPPPPYYDHIFKVALSLIEMGLELLRDSDIRRQANPKGDG